MENFAPFSAEAWEYVGQMTLLGMGMVFAVLGLLWMVLTVFKLVFVGKNKKESPREKVETPNHQLSSKPISAPAVNSSAQSDEEIAAVIMAAITAYMAEQGVSADGFRVVSFNRVKNGRAWNGK